MCVVIAAAVVRGSVVSVMGCFSISDVDFWWVVEPFVARTEGSIASFIGVFWGCLNIPSDPALDCGKGKVGGSISPLVVDVGFRFKIDGSAMSSAVGVSPSLLL